jgi:hypothetical protein
MDHAHLVGIFEGLGGLDAEVGEGAEELAGAVGAVRGDGGEGVRDGE